MKNQRYLESKKLSIVLFLFLFLLYAVVYMTKNMFSSALAIIVENGDMTKSQAGLINAMFWLVYAVFQVFGGFAVDKYSPYKLIMIGLFGAVISNAVIYYNQSYNVMMISWMFNALMQFGVWPGVFKIISTQTTPSFRHTAVYWMFFATSVGLAISMLVASYVTDWKNNFLVSVVSLLIMMVLYMILNRYLEGKMVTEEIKIPRKKETKEANKTKAPMLSLMVASGMWVFMLVSFMRVAIDNGIKMMTPVMLMESYATLPAALSTRISSVLVVFSAIGVFLTGFVKMKVTQNETKAQILLYILSMPVILMVCLVGRIHYLWILLALSVSVMLVHGAAPFSQSFVALRFGKYDRIGTVSGILNATASVGNIFASYVFAKMAELMPWSGVITSWLVALVVCSLLCVIIMPRWTRFIEE